MTSQALEPRSESAAGDPEARCAVLTVGHSTRPIETFIELLHGHGVTQLVDVRTLPRAGIGYAHAPGLGGFRKTTADSANAGWRNLSFRGYADYMQTPDFAAELANVIELARTDRVALMCAEAVPWRCHRSLIADALVVDGIRAEEIINATRLQVHTLTPFARVDGTVITYPPQAPLPRDPSGRSRTRRSNTRNI